MDSTIWYEWTKVYDASCPTPECAPFNDTSLRDPDVLDLHQTVHRLKIPRSSRPPIVHHIWVHNKIFGPDAMTLSQRPLIGVYDLISNHNPIAAHLESHMIYLAVTPLAHLTHPTF